jgi:hypothetical protein
MTFISKMVLCAAVMLCTPFAAAAKDDGLPNIDIQKRCHDRARTIDTMWGDKSISTNAFDTCVRSEEEARAALTAAWKDIPPAYKAFCIRPNVYSPSNAEWISCIESNMDVKRLRTKNGG